MPRIYFKKTAAETTDRFIVNCGRVSTPIGIIILTTEAESDSNEGLNQNLLIIA